MDFIHLRNVEIVKNLPQLVNYTPVYIKDHRTSFSRQTMKTVWDEFEKTMIIFVLYSLIRTRNIRSKYSIMPIVPVNPAIIPTHTKDDYRLTNT